MESCTRFFKFFLTFQTRCRFRTCSHFAQIKQRQCAAGGLLCAAIRIAVERHQQSWHIKCRTARHANADKSTIKQAFRQKAAIDSHTSAIGREIDDMAARDRQIDRTHRQCQGLFNVKACIVGKPDSHTTGTRCHSIERNGDRLSFATFKRNAFRIGANFNTEIIGGLKAHTIIAVRCIRIGNIEADIGLIAGGAMKRGRPAVMTTGSRMITSVTA